MDCCSNTRDILNKNVKCSDFWYVIFADVNDACVTTNDTHALLRKNVQERKAMVLMKDKMEEERRLVRAQNGSVTASGSPAACSTCTVTKAALGKPFVASTTATPPKRILPKSASEDLDALQKLMINSCSSQKLSASVESIVPSARTAAIPQSGSASSAHFMLMSPNTSHVESPVIVLPSPIVSSRPVSQVVASSAVLHKSQPSNQTILLLPTANHAVHLPQLKPVPGSATIRNLSFADNSGSAGVLVHGSKHLIMPCFQNAVVATASASCTVDVGSTRMSVAETAPHVNAVAGSTVPVLNYVSKPPIAASQSNVLSTAGLTGTVATSWCTSTKSLVRNTSRSQPAHKNSCSSSVSSSSSKTVMSLLRENNGRDLEWKMYMKDSRPVASLLKEERQKQQMQLSVPAHLTTIAVQTVYQPVVLCQPLPASEQFAQFNLLSAENERSVMKPSAVARRSSFERPCSVSDLLNLATLYTTVSDVPSATMSSLSVGATRKRPHTALDEPQAVTVPSEESFRVQGLDRTLNIDLIEKSALDDFLSDSGILSTLPKNEPLKADDIGTEFDLDIAEPPPAKVSLVNRSAENMTLQQLQQATLSRKSLREHCKQSHPDPSFPPLFAGRPVSTLGEPMSSFDVLSVRDSRPNTVAAFWEPAVFRDSSSSVGSCDSQIPDFSAANAYSHFMPIQNLSEDIPSTSDLVRPTAKVPVSGLNEVNAKIGLELQASTAAAEVVKHDRGERRRRFRHKSLNRSIPQACSGEQLTVLSDCGAANFTTERTDSPLSAEITDIIASEQRLHLGFADLLGHGSEETPSPYRSRSVPASVMLDFSLSDALAAEFTGDGSLDMLAGGTEPACNNSQLTSLRNLPVSSDINFWDRPARGDHLISGVSFRPLPRTNGTVVRMTSESKETEAIDVVTHTPPSSANASPNFESVFEPSEREAVAVAIDTPTSLESASVSDRLVEELFKEVCENNTELLGWDCSS